MQKQKVALVIGAGAAGITAAYELALNTDIKPIVIETESVIGGLAKTICFDGFKTDIGPHRFFTKSQDVMQLWTKILQLQGKKEKDDILLDREVCYEEGFADPEKQDNVFLKRKRFSRIYYKNKFYDYPVKINLRTIVNMGFVKTLLAGLSYLKSCLIKRKENNLEDFMINRFGKVLYETFFEFYTQKVWGRHPQKISKDWGNQRIKGLSLLSVVKNMFCRTKEASLIDEYFYPKFGAGQIWDEMAKIIIENGGEVHLNAKVLGVNIFENKVLSVKVQDKNGVYDWYGDYILSSMPVKDLILSMNDVSDVVKNAAEGLPYRDYQLICFKVKNFNLKNETRWKTVNNICPDSWIYVQDRNVKAGRIYIPKNFSPYLCEDIDDMLVCLEYFCDKGDELWEMSDDEIFSYASNELIKLKGLKSLDDIEKAYRYKVEKAYPAYFDTYSDFSRVKNYIDSIENLYLIGRNGQHKYNNMDHSVLSGITAVKIISQGLEKSDLWNVNAEQNYQETI